jgi:membrane fusion protein (multidrug efflux system)
MKLSPLCLAAAFGCLLAIGCKEKEKPVTEIPPVKMQVVPVVREDVPIYTEFVGQTFGQSDVEIMPRVEGWIQAMHYKEGGEVKQGQVLYSIDPLPYQNKLDQARGNLAESRTLMEKAKADLSRIEPLAEMKAVSQRELVASKAQYGAAQARVQSMEALVRNAQLELGYTKVKAPISGTIGISNVRVGDFVGGSRVVLNTVSQIQTVRVRFTMSETEFLRLYRITKQQGNASLNPQAQLILSDGNLYARQGTVNLVDRQVDPATGALTFEASFTNEDKILRPGQYVKVRLLTESKPGSLLIPQRAVAELQGQNQVFVVGDSNKVQMKLIQTGARYGRYVIVEGGLTEGEQIVLGGTQLLRNGMRVIPQKVDPSDSTALAIPQNQ